MTRESLGSSTIPSAGYDPDRAILEIEFASGRVYRYFDVPRSVWDWLRRVPGKGRFVNAQIVDRYRFERDGVAEPSDARLRELLGASLDAER